ncbi:MAG: methylenetetrahydrofolate reductase C-terminal domain-containing protein, partial [Verrucomicrobiae bacterium]|nr:methylenetetrahydrofolate reductase C-terminal domain-containing protein [Verrucomicrobiae bacterium]
RMCGACVLSHTGMSCPMNCPKQMRNGPCGGSHDGRCELDDKECLWARAYERLRYYGEHEHMLDGPAVFYNASLEGTSSWANFYRHRDHHAATKTAPPKPKPKTDQQKEKPT